MNIVHHLFYDEDGNLTLHLSHEEGRHPVNLYGEEICIRPEPCGPDCPYNTPPEFWQKNIREQSR